MPADPLREKLKALVEEWRERQNHLKMCRGYNEKREVYCLCAQELAALLVESEPCTVQECKDLGQCAFFREPNPGKTHYQGDDCPGGHESKCGYCGAKCERCAQPSKPKLKHRFIHVPGTNDYCGFVTRHHGDCGRTREAH